MLSIILFIALLLAGSGLFFFNARKVYRNINLGKAINRSDRPGERLKTMLLVAFGQSKMVRRPVAGILHLFVYLGFVIINLEVLEIVIDGLFGTHRIFAKPLGPLYNILIGSFEILAFLVLAACVIFLIRRNIIKLKRFVSKDLAGWPKSDANIILATEIALMTAFLCLNAADFVLQQRNFEGNHYQVFAGVIAGSFPVSSFIAPLFAGINTENLELLERACWWFHIVGIFAFLNYLPYSKHFHILLAFPTTYFSKLEPKGEFNNMEAVSTEVKLMLDPSAVPPPVDPAAVPMPFGAKDVFDLTWKNLLDSYSCTECGRCTSVCPANITGKLLSPRKIMMDTRDRLEEVGENIDKNKQLSDDGKSLHSYISAEELWACTSCNACTMACPINLDPLNIIVEMRRYLVMEQSAAPQELQLMMNNVENNGAPWQFSPADRYKWAEE